MDRSLGRSSVCSWSSLAVAGGYYLWFRSQVKEANERVEPEVIDVLTEKPSSTIVTVPVPESPSAMNLLVLGSDRRPDEEDEAARSDTIILVHVDPDNDYLSMLSLPRDLRVDVPGYGLNKLNYAFHVGGPALTIQTIEQLTGVDINHYLEVSFEAFRDITDSLGGVYVDVDQRYYNDNPNFELIKLSPGYQLLHGADALDFVRYRHDLNLDFGRMERQQAFLSAMREQAMGWDLPFKLPGLVSSLFDNVATDLDANEVIKLAYWTVKLDGNRMRRVALTGSAEEVGGVAYVLAEDSAIADAVGSFLTLPGTERLDEQAEQHDHHDRRGDARPDRHRGRRAERQRARGGGGRGRHLAQGPGGDGRDGGQCRGGASRDGRAIRLGHVDRRQEGRQGLGRRHRLERHGRAGDARAGGRLPVAARLRAAARCRHHLGSQGLEGHGQGDPVRHPGAGLHSHGLLLRREAADQRPDLRHRGRRQWRAGLQDALPAQGARRVDRPVHGPHGDHLARRAGGEQRPGGRARRAHAAPSSGRGTRSTASGGKRTACSTGSRTPCSIF